jgi:hypothetical protein
MDSAAPRQALGRLAEAHALAVGLERGRGAEGGAAMRWLRDKTLWIMLFAAIAAVSSSYSAYKVYQMTDGKAPPTKAKGRR